MTDTYECDWRHGPAPGLTFYSGTIKVEADDHEGAERRARRLVATRGCFSIGCIEITAIRCTRSAGGGPR